MGVITFHCDAALGEYTMSVGIWQLVLILIIIFALFGAGKLPKVMGDIGSGVRNLKDGLKGADKKDEEKRGE